MHTNWKHFKDAGNLKTDRVFSSEALAFQRRQIHFFQIKALDNFGNCQKTMYSHLVYPNVCIK